MKKRENLPLGIKLILGALSIGVLKLIYTLFNSLRVLIFNQEYLSGLETLAIKTDIFFSIIFATLIIISIIHLYRKKKSGRILAFIIFGLTLFPLIAPLNLIYYLKEDFWSVFPTLIFAIVSLISIIYLATDKKVKEIYSSKKA